MMKFHNSIFFSFIAPRTSHLAPRTSHLAPRTSYLIAAAVLQKL